MSRHQRQLATTLREHLRSLSAKDPSSNRDGFDAEMNELQMVDYRTQNNPDAFVTASLAPNMPKNRFAEVRANEATRVRLQTLSGGDDGPYINANYVDAREMFDVPFTYIATQAPLPATVFDFWRMVFENHVFFIIMLCDAVEEGKIKSEVYWPSEGKVLDFGVLQVKSLSERRDSGLVSRSLLLRTPRGEEQRVSHMQYIGWPDQGIPETSAPLMRMIQNMGKSKFSVQAPIVVHCSGGIGRTGVFIALHVALAHFQMERRDIDIRRIVHDLKLCRTGMVQRRDQYVFLYYAVLREMNRMILSTESGVDLLDLRRRESVVGKTASSGPQMGYPGRVPISRPPPLRPEEAPHATCAFQSSPRPAAAFGQRRVEGLFCTPPRHLAGGLAEAEAEAEQRLLETYMKQRVRSTEQAVADQGPSKTHNRETNARQDAGNGVLPCRNNRCVNADVTTRDGAALEGQLQHWKTKNKNMRFSTTIVGGGDENLRETKVQNVPDSTAGVKTIRRVLRVPKSKSLSVERLTTEQYHTQERQSHGEITSTRVTLEPSLPPVSIIITPQEATTRNLDSMLFSDNEGSPMDFFDGTRGKSNEPRLVNTVAPRNAANVAGSMVTLHDPKKVDATLFFNQPDGADVNKDTLLSRPGPQLIAKDEFERL